MTGIFFETSSSVLFAMTPRSFAFSPYGFYRPGPQRHSACFPLNYRPPLGRDIHPKKNTIKKCTVFQMVMLRFKKNGFVLRKNLAQHFLSSKAKVRFFRLISFKNRKSHVPTNVTKVTNDYSIIIVQFATVFYDDCRKVSDGQQYVLRKLLFEILIFQLFPHFFIYDRFKSTVQIAHIF